MDNQIYGEDVANQQPYAPYMMHKTEMNAHHGLYVSYAKLYIDHKVGTRFVGMTWDKFLELTKPEVDIIIDICIGETDRELTEQKKITEQLNGNNGGNKPNYNPEDIFKAMNM